MIANDLYTVLFGFDSSRFDKLGQTVTFLYENRKRERIVFLQSGQFSNYFSNAYLSLEMILKYSSIEWWWERERKY